MKPPLEIWGFLKFPSFLRAQMSFHMARILELFQYYLKTFLNFENSLRFENLFKTKATYKNSQGTGVRFGSRVVAVTVFDL